ncbi:MAG: AtpZ/AtpI family protein [Oscillospiraceae bacterium]
MKSKYKFLRNIVWITQLGLSVAVPLVLCILAAVWLRNRFGLGGWIMAVGVLLGVCGAISGLWSSMRNIQREAGEEDKKPPKSYNDHE